MDSSLDDTEELRPGDEFIFILDSDQENLPSPEISAQYMLPHALPKTHDVTLPREVATPAVAAKTGSVSVAKEESNVGENEDILSDKEEKEEEDNKSNNEAKEQNLITAKETKSTADASSSENQTDFKPTSLNSESENDDKESIENFSNLDVHLEEVMDQENNAVTSESEAIDLEEPIQQESEIVEPGINKAKPPTDQQRTKEIEMNPNPIEYTTVALFTVPYDQYVDALPIENIPDDNDAQLVTPHPANTSDNKVYQAPP